MANKGRQRARTRSAIAGLAAGVVALVGITPVWAAMAGEQAGSNEFHQTNLVSDLSTEGARFVDPALKNPWGLALSPTSPLWVANNASATATLYSIGAGGATVTAIPLMVTIPGGRASTGDGPSPTGQVFNGAAGAFGGARFIFSSESGQITAWKGGTMAQLEYSSPTAVYKGLAIATGPGGPLLYASNFHDGTVDVFDTTFSKISLAGSFTDPELAQGYAPFGIESLHGLIYVTYAQQNALMHDDVAGVGHGFVDIYTVDGFLVKRLATRGSLNSPWGLATAPAGFGPFAGKLLVGNFGDGHINVFDPFTGHHLGQLRDEQDQPVTVDGLWALKAGTANTGGTGTVLFSAGINGESDGLVGALTSASD